MPGRKTPLVTGETYHVFNRGIDRRPTFTAKYDCHRAVASLKFYRTFHPPLSFSKFLRLADEKRREIEQVLERREKIVEVLCYALMPNHFHLLLRQVAESGIATFLSNMQNSYTRYFNTRHERDGSLFLDQFKAIRIETDDQLIHVSRYIHLNPYTGFVVKSLEKLEKYPWSSLSDYLYERESFVETESVLGMFRTAKAYKTFVFDQADYQRRLKEIEHLTFD